MKKVHLKLLLISYKVERERERLLLNNTHYQYNTLPALFTLLNLNFLFFSFITVPKIISFKNSPIPHYILWHPKSIPIKYLPILQSLYIIIKGNPWI